MIKMFLAVCLSIIFSIDIFFNISTVQKNYGKFTLSLHGNYVKGHFYRDLSCLSINIMKTVF